MNFERTDEQRAIAETARDLLAARRDSPDLWDELCALGWPGIAVAEEHDGQGLGVLELAIITEELGYACAATPFLGTVLAALAISTAGGADGGGGRLAELATGGRLGALALAGRADLIPDAAADRLAVLLSEPDGTATVYDDGAIDDAEAIDPGRCHGIVRTSLGAGQRLDVPVRSVVDQAAVVVAAELVGLSRRALDLTLSFVKEREQFGVPVGSFQAVQHNAAEMFRATESAAVATTYAAWVADHEPAALGPAAAMAKSSASSAGIQVTAAAIQLHGGIGFTWEADLHWLYKRAQVDAHYLGSGDFHRARLARAVASGLASGDAGS